MTGDYWCHCLQDRKFDTWEATIDKIRGLLQEEYGRHQELIDSDKLSQYEKNYFTKILNSSANEVELTSALERLSKMLAVHYGKAPIIIINEYDTPIQEGYSKDFYDEIIGFMRNFFSGAFKDNKNLSYGFLTGILRIAQESIFSGLNNLSVNTVMDEEYDSFFGFTSDEVKKMLSDGAKPDEIINNSLIPAINEVGELFNQKKYFLPQLIGSANTMKLAIEHLEPLLEKKDSGEDMPTLVIATVEGDIHDIGKNLVVLMLKNYGYNVIDMGKDVPCEDIVNKAIETNAAVIGLSALMTTTMMRMKDVVEICKEKGCKSKVVIGGACITQSFADEIGADGYSKDAAECVKLVERLLNS